MCACVYVSHALCTELWCVCSVITSLSVRNQACVGQIDFPNCD